MLRSQSDVCRVLCVVFIAIGSFAASSVSFATTITVDAPGCSAGGALSWNAATKTVYCLGATSTPTSTLKLGGPDCPAGTSLAWSAASVALSCQIAAGAASAASLQIGVSLPDCIGRSVSWFAATNTLTCRLVAQTASLNVDQSTASVYDPLTDGLQIMRYLFGVRGDALTANALGATALRKDPVAIVAYLDGMRAALDVDNNGTVDALTDGTLILRYLFGLRGAALINGAVGAGATPGAIGAIEGRIQAMMP